MGVARIARDQNTFRWPGNDSALGQDRQASGRFHRRRLQCSLVKDGQISSVFAFSAALALTGSPTASPATPLAQASVLVAVPVSDQEAAPEQAASTLPDPPKAAEPKPAEAEAPDQPPSSEGLSGTALPGADAEEEIVVLGRTRRGDPLEPLNAQSFAATQAVDEAVMGPVARAYKNSVPRPIRDGLRNFLANLREPVVAANYLLQLKPGKTIETLGRFALNSTAGAAGLVDVAKRRPFNLPRRRNGFANTLGYYGVKPGPFFFMPLIGPTTLRDLVGNGIDQFASPLGMIKPFNRPAFTIPVAGLSALDFRAEFDEQLTTLRATADPYASVRKHYLTGREAEIDALRRGGPPPKPRSGKAD
jgi:phospholipid-binding lipoprotein MlaA